MKKAVAALLFASVLSLFGTAVNAQEEDCPDSPSVCVGGTVLTPDPAGPTVDGDGDTGSTDESAVASTGSGTLPVTGGDAAAMIGVGGAMVVGGLVLLRTRKLATVKSD